jgi:biopolymer transport protein ExbD
MKIKKFDSINVVPFIDIILVLLVIVLTTASFVVKGLIPIDLSDAKSSNKYKIKPKELIITIKEDGQIYLNKDKIEKNNFEQDIKNYKTNTIISINCDKNAKFDNFVFIMNILKNNNFTNLGIITNNE